MDAGSRPASRRPQLNRYLDGRKTVGGQEETERVGDDGGLYPRVVRERLHPEYFSEDLLRK
jgi:hypothetical protein